MTNIDHRIKGTIEAANKLLAKLEIDPISERVTPHSLRRTYASVRAAAGDHPVCIAEQLGHEDPGFTFRVYQRAVKRRDRLADAYLGRSTRRLNGQRSRFPIAVAAECRRAAGTTNRVATP